MANTRYSRSDDWGSERLPVRFLAEAGYDLVALKQVLEQVTGGARQPEFLSTHPSACNRLDQTRKAVEA